VADTPLRVPLTPTLLRTRVIAVLRAADGAHLLPVARTLVQQGVMSIEVTLNTPGALDAIPRLRDELDEEAEVGIGTVLTRADAERVIRAGVDYVVTPHVVPEVVATVRDAGLPVVPGALTPTEVRAAWDLGASAVKVFPAALVGAEYVAHLRGPFPDIPLIPSGGVSVAAACAWVQAGAPAVSMGSPLRGDALAGGDLGALADRAAALVHALATVDREPT